MPESTTRPSPETGRAERRGKRVRIDEGNARGPETAPGRGSLLRAFGAWGSRAARSAAVAAQERRVAPRHEQVECLAWVGWKTFRRFHMRDALVINLSRGGAQIFLDSPPAGKRPVWVFLETPGENAIVKARVVGLQTTPQGQCAIRVAFDEPCPYAVFEAAVCGLSPTNPTTRMARTPGMRTPSRRVIAGWNLRTDD